MPTRYILIAHSNGAGCMYRYYQPKSDAEGRNTVDYIMGETVAKEYELVYEGPLPGFLTARDMLDHLWMVHNRDNRPRNTEIRAMSIGDIIVLRDMEQGNFAFVVSRLGFARLSDPLPSGVEL